MNEVEWKQIERHDINLTLCSIRPTSPHHPSAICDGIIEADNTLSLSPTLRPKSTSVAHNRNSLSLEYRYQLRQSPDFGHAFVELEHIASSPRQEGAKIVATAPNRATQIDNSLVTSAVATEKRSNRTTSVVAWLQKPDWSMQMLPDV